jgi:hypothetical protein
MRLAEREPTSLERGASAPRRILLTAVRHRALLPKRGARLVDDPFVPVTRRAPCRLRGAVRAQKAASERAGGILIQFADVLVGSRGSGT